MYSLEYAVYLVSLADALDEARRFGADLDKPEGSRWVQLSDSLAREVAERLRTIARSLAGRG